MPDAWIEHGIGETRAIVVANNAIVEAHVERSGNFWRVGDVRDVRLATVLGTNRRRGIVAADGVEAVIEPVPSGLTEGMSLRAIVVREALDEPGRRKLARVVATDGTLARGPTLVDRLRSRNLAIAVASRHDPDLFEALGWSEVVEVALSGHVVFVGGSLTITPTPAMTVIDVDGDLPLHTLALTAADAVAAAILRFDITGSIGIDFPTVSDKAVRRAIGTRLDAALPAPFERTAVNGFGFAQIVRPRLRSSFIETMQNDRIATAALRLLRTAERSVGRCTIVAGARVTPWLAARPALLEELERYRGGEVTLREEAAMPISAEYVERSR